MPGWVAPRFKPFLLSLAKLYKHVRSTPGLTEDHSQLNGGARDEMLQVTALSRLEGSQNVMICDRATQTIDAWIVETDDRKALFDNEHVGSKTLVHLSTF